MMIEFIKFVFYEANKTIIEHSGEIIGFLIITLVAECLTTGKDNRNRNKTAITEFRKIISEEREKLIKNASMDINRQENAYATVYHQLFIIQKLRIRKFWNKYIDTEKKEKESIQYWVLYHNKAEIIKCLDNLIKFK